MTIVGTEHIVRTGDYEFEIIIDDYSSGGAYLFELKKLIITVSWKDPLTGEDRNIEVRTLIAKE